MTRDPLLWAAVVFAVLTGARGITDGQADTAWADSPRHLMNGVLLYDALRDLPGVAADPLGFAERYYAKYPALSLGHHPPLLPAALVPFYALFGVSLGAARVVMLAFFVMATILMYVLAARQVDTRTAGWAALLLATSPFLAQFARTTQPEMPAIALVLGAMLAAVAFRASGRASAYILFVALAIASLLARQTAIFVGPAYAALLVAARPALRDRRVVVAVTLAGAVVIAAVAVATVQWSPFNVGVVRDVLLRGPRVGDWIDALASIGRTQVGWPVVALAATAAALATARGDRRPLLAAYWIAAVVGAALITTANIEAARYTVLALPAWCMAAAALPSVAVRTPWRVAAMCALAVTVCWQAWLVLRQPLVRTGAYAAAARYVVDRAGGNPATVLYRSSRDTGYFVFFVRAHDPAGRLVTLRADKLLTTSLMGNSAVADRIERPDEVYRILREYGTRFVVTDNQTIGSAALDWLLEHVQGPRFVERLRIPMAPGENGAAAWLGVYEYLEAASPDPDAAIHLQIPLVNRDVRVRLSDLRAAPHR